MDILRKNPMNRLAVLASGMGSLLQAIIAAKVPVDLVIVDRNCTALEIAKASNIKIILLERSDFTAAFDYDSYTQHLLAVLKQHDVGFIAMAGFMTILSKELFLQYEGRILNSHPSLLPAFKGRRAVRDALQSGVPYTGCTIHYATAALDDGTIVKQVQVPILPGDTEAQLHERIKSEERKIYPFIIQTEMARLGLMPT